MFKKLSGNTEKNIGRVSYSFKITSVTFIFILTLLRLSLLAYFPSNEIIPDKIFLFAVLVIVMYLWIQEEMDFHSLLAVNKDLRDSHEQLKQAEVDAIAALVKVEEAKDLYTSGHSERVTKISLAIAEEMNLTKETKKIIARAGALHDIGKIGISDDILHKKEKLTDEEWLVIRNHPQEAIKILEPLKFLSTEREIILSHHERYDGKGYPRGVKAEEIPTEAMILSIADAFDAMNSKRPYRDPLTKDAIIAELIKGRDTQHSAQILDIFLILLNKKPQLWNI